MKPIFLFAFALIALPAIAQTSQHETPILHEVFKNYFRIGTAIDRAQIYADDPAATQRIVRADRRGYFLKQEIMTDSAGLQLAARHFNSITPENVMKWEEIHPAPGVYDFDAADRFVEFADANNMHIVAHTLVWHNQTPDWVFVDEDGKDLSREALLAKMEEHIKTVVGRYKGRIHAWDVVNEAFNMDGTFRESKWYQIIGEDYIRKAFEYAHQADPEAKLYYNDYALENPEKRKGIIDFIQTLLQQKVPVTGIGSQSHLSLNNMPAAAEIEQKILDFYELGLEFMITELDINVLPSARVDGRLRLNTDIYKEGLPNEIEQKLAGAYKDLFRMYLKHSDKINRVTLWGISDAGSWLNYLPLERRNYPLLFDYDNKPKAAFFAIIDAAKKHEQ